MNKRLVSISMLLMLLISTLSIAVQIIPTIANPSPEVIEVTPQFKDHEGEEVSFNPAYVQFSSYKTTLGAHSVKMCIPDGAIPDDRQGLGLNVETPPFVLTNLATYDDISFKVYFEEPDFDPDPTKHAPLYVTLILHDKTHDVLVSMIPTELPYVYPGGSGWGSASMAFSAPDSNGWRTATPDPSGLWIAWSFAGGGWPGLTANWYDEVMNLSDWDTYIAANSLDVELVKVNIQFGYRPPVVYQDWDKDGTPEPHPLGTSWGTVYVDGLSYNPTLDFEPPPETIEVSQPVQLTTHTNHDRNPSFFRASDGKYWLFFVHGRGPELRPFWDIYYMTSTDNGTTWSTPTNVSASVSPTGQRGMAAFQDNTGKIWIFVSAPKDLGIDSNIHYYTFDGTTWTGPTDVPGPISGNHVDALQTADGKIWIFYESAGVKAMYYDGTSWSSVITVSATGGIPKAIEADGKLHAVWCDGSTGKIYYSNSTDGTTWSTLQVVVDVVGIYNNNDPVISVDSNGTYWLFYAPWTGRGGGLPDSQWIEVVYSSDGGATWSPRINVTSGGYGSVYWDDMWPEPYLDSNGKMLLFYTSERNANGTSRIDRNIWMFDIVWDLRNNHYEFIQTAIDAASSGDTILVHNGTYREVLVINKSLTINAASKPIIEAPDTLSAYTFPESGATWNPIIFVYGGTKTGGTVSGSGTISVTLIGFEIDGRNKAGSARYVAILCRNVKPGTISNNTIHNMYDADGQGNGPETFGILTYGNSSVTIEHNEVRDFSRGGIGVSGDGGALPDPVGAVKWNTVLGNGLETGTGWWAENGIQIAWGAGGSVVENYVADCKVNNPSWVSTGILIHNATYGVNILNNTVEDCDSGISVSSPSFDLIDGNVVTGCTWDGIRLGWPVDNCTVSNNAISYCWAGIGVYDASDNTIEHNLIVNNEYGIYMDGDSHNNEILQNDILNNSVDGIHVEPYYGADPSGTKVHYNNIVDNGVCGVNKTGTESVDARFNWWGNASGPAHSSNPDGTGDTISDNVDYSPWLGATFETTPRTYHVNPSGAPGAIQEAIDEAASGDTIIVHDGTYNEALYINKSLTIKAASTPVIQGSQLFNTNYGVREAVVFVEDAANVVLEGFDIEGLGFGSGAPKSYGVIYEESSGTIRNCIVSTNMVGDMYDVGIAAWDGSSLTVDSCEVKNFGRIGVFYYDGCSGLVYNSTIEGQVYNDENYVNYGIEIETWSYSCDIDIIGNEIYNCDNTHPSPKWSSAGIVIDGWRALYDVPSSIVFMQCNDIHDNYYGIEVVANQYSYAHYNNIYNNREYGVIQDPDYANNNVTFDARYNWWGDSTGPYHPTLNPSGSGDNVSDYVLFAPWLLQEKVPPLVHDVAVVSVVSDVAHQYPGRIVNITVVVKNNGNMYETFNVTVYRNTTAIGTILVTDLGIGENTTLIFLWDTTGLTPCNNWTISAEAPLVGDINPSDNNRTDGSVKIKMIGDVNADGVVDGQDVVITIEAIPSYPGHPWWNPQADLDNDGVVDGADLVIAIENIGLTCPP